MVAHCASWFESLVTLVHIILTQPILAEDLIFSSGNSFPLILAVLNQTQINSFSILVEG